MSLKLPYLKRAATRINQKQQGFSLVELLIAMTIGIFAVGAALSVLSESEARKRSTSSVNNSNQAGAYAVYQLDQAIRSAGTGLGHESATSLNLPSAYGCLLNLAKSGTRLAPKNPLPAPFDKTTGNVRIAPVLIHNGPVNTGGDVIITMAGTSGRAEMPTKFGGSGSTTAALNLENSVNFMANDKILLIGESSSDCFVSQVESTFTASEAIQQMGLAGTYHKDTIRSRNITDASQYVLNLGQTPNFNIFAVGANDTLFAYNLFEPAAPNTNTPNPSILINNIDQIQALYGVEVGGVFQWVRPTGTVYGFGNIRNNITTISSIKAIKLAIIMKSELEEKDRVTNRRITIFKDTNIPMNIAISVADRKFRYQAFEVTIPVRNNLLQQ